MFLSDLHVERVDNKRWKLLSALTYVYNDEKYTAPKSFITDFASVPRIPFVYYLAGNTAHRAAVIHDWLYWTGDVSRKTADKIFYNAMLEDREPKWRAKIMYRTVRLFAGGQWRKYRAKNVTENLAQKA